MDEREVLGWILIGLGIIFMVAGLIQALTRDRKTAGRLSGVDPPDWGDVILELIKGGLGIIAVGLALLLIGLDMTGTWDVFKNESASMMSLLMTA